MATHVSHSFSHHFFHGRASSFSNGAALAARLFLYKRLARRNRHFRFVRILHRTDTCLVGIMEVSVAFPGNKGRKKADSPGGTSPPFDRGGAIRQRHDRAVPSRTDGSFAGGRASHPSDAGMCHNANLRCRNGRIVLAGWRQAAQSFFHA